MKVVIGKPLNTRKNTFEVVAKFMHGDADFYEDVSFYCDEEEVIEYWKFYKEYGKLSWNSRREETSSVDGFWKLFTTNTEEDIAMERYWGDDLWPLDKTGGWNFRAGLDRMSFYYYDENGVKYHVEVKDDD